MERDRMTRDLRDEKRSVRELECIVEVFLSFFTLLRHAFPISLK